MTVENLLAWVEAIPPIEEWGAVPLLIVPLGLAVMFAIILKWGHTEGL